MFDMQTFYGPELGSRQEYNNTLANVAGELASAKQIEDICGCLMNGGLVWVPSQCKEGKLHPMKMVS